MIICVSCVLLLTKSITYACIFFHLWNMCCFIVRPPLGIGFGMDFKADTAVWGSDIDSVMLEDWLQEFEGCSW
jgi:hypothetical protein